MKKILVLMAITGGVVFAACSDDKARYVDLRSGETITVEKDPQTGAWVNSTTKEPVYIYVDTKNNDTIYGRTGATINGKVVKRDEVYWYAEDNDYKVKYNSDSDPNTVDGDYKKKVEADGDVKIKTEDQKIKIDGETGEKKVKNDD